MMKGAPDFFCAAVAALLLFGCKPSSQASVDALPRGQSALFDAASSAPPLQRGAVDTQLTQLANELIARHQPNEAFDPELECWRDASPDGTRYCLTATNFAKVAEGGRDVLYVLAANVTPADSDTYQYSHASAGWVRAFAAELQPDGQLGTDLAAVGGARYGSNGSSGAEEATLLRLGHSHHAWHFVSGGVWQGIVVTQHALLAREGSTFVEVSAIPETEEADQANRYDIAVDFADITRRDFPLIVSKSAVNLESLAASTSAQVLERWTVERHAATGLYRLPNEAEKESMP